MITTLTGPNAYLIKKNLKKIIDTFKVKNAGLNIERVDGEENDFDQIYEAFSGLSLFASNKLVVAANPGSQKQFAEKFELILEAIPDSTEVVIIEPKLDRRLNYYKLLKSKTQFIECGNVEASELSSWIIKQVEGYGSSISLADARYLLDRVGQDQMKLDSESRKLATYSPAKISRKDIDDLTSRSPQSTIFDLIDAAMKGRVDLALKLYEEQRQQLVEPQQTIAMLAWQLHVLAILLSAKGKNIQDIASESKINPFVARKTQDLSRNVSIQDTKSLIKDLLDIDTKMKSTSIDADEALKAYIVGLGQIVK